MKNKCRVWKGLIVGILLYNVSVSAVMFNPHTNPGVIDSFYPVSTETPVAQNQTAQNQTVNLLSGISVDEEFKYINVLNSIDSLNYNQQELKSSRRGFTLLASAVDTGSLFVQLQLLNELSKLPGAELVKVSGFLPGVKLSFDTDENVFIFPHILDSSYCVIFSEGKSNKLAEDRDSEIKGLIESLKAKIENDYLSSPGKIEDLLRGYILQDSFNGREESQLTAEEKKVLDAKCNNYMSSLSPQSSSLPEMLTESSLKELMEGKYYDSGKDTLTITTDEKDLWLLSEYIGNKNYKLREEEDHSFLEAVKTQGVSFTEQMRDWSNVDSIQFNLLFSPNQTDEDGNPLEKPLYTVLAFKLQDMSGKNAVAYIDLSDYTTEGKVSLKKSDFTADTDFNWSKVNTSSWSIEYDLKGTCEDNYITIDDKVELAGIALTSKAQDANSLLEEFQEKEFLKQAVIQEWYGGDYSLVDKGALDKSVAAMLSETAGGLTKGKKSLFEVLAEVVVTGDNLKFLAGEKNRNVKTEGSFGNSSADQAILKEFEQILAGKYDDAVSMLQLSAGRQLSLRRSAWSQYVSERKKHMPPNPEAEYLTNHILSLIKGYLNMEDTGDVSDFGGGAYFYNALYWLGSQLPEVVRFSSEEKKQIEAKVDARVQKLQERFNVGNLSDKSRQSIKNDVEVDFALRKIYKEMAWANIPVTIPNFIKWVTKNFTDSELDKIRGDLKRNKEYSNSDINRILNCKYNMNQIQEIERVLRGNMAILPSVSQVLGPPSTSYLQRIEDESIGDKDFMRLQLEDIADVIVNKLYVEIDDDKAVLLDATGGIHGNIAAMGMGIELIAALSQPEVGIIDYEQGQEMCRKLMNSILYIQKQQPKGEWINQLLGKYPFVLLEKLAGEASNYLSEGPLMAKVDSLQTSGQILEKEAESLKNEIKNGKFKITDSDLKILTQAYLEGKLTPQSELAAKFKEYSFAFLESLAGGFVDYLKNPETLNKEISALVEEKKMPDDTSKIEALQGIEVTDDDIREFIKADFPQKLNSIDKYGWGGWLYHFANTADLSRPDNYVEISPVDTMEYFFYALYATKVFPELKSLFEDSFSMVDVDNSLLYPNSDISYRLLWATDLNRGAVNEKGFDKDKEHNRYYGDERMIIDYMRILWHAMEDGTSVGDLSSEFYAVADAKSTIIPGIGMQYSVPANWQNAGWTRGLFHANIGRGLARSKNTGYSMYQESQEAYYALHMSAMQDSGYPPQALGPDQCDVPAGFQMHYGQKGALALNAGVSNDGTYSPYSWGHANPMLGDWASWYMYKTDRHSFHGRWISYDSVNEEKDFYSPTMYLLNLGYYGLGLINRYQNNLVQDTYGGIDLVQDANRAAGFVPVKGGGTFTPDTYCEDLVTALTSENPPTFTGQEAYDEAEKLVSYTVELAYESATRRDEKGADIHDYYLNHNDDFYKEADKLIDTVIGTAKGELLVKAMALKFVIDKNQNYVLSQTAAFAQLAGLVQGNSAYTELAANVISQFDYEAKVIYKGYDPSKITPGDNTIENLRKGLIPILSSEEIKQDLENFPEEGRTWTYPGFQEYLSEDRKIYPLIAEESGILMPLYKGGTTSEGESYKGLKQLVEKWGWDQAIRIMREEFKIQATLKPYVEQLLGRDIDLTNPDDAGFLTSWAARVKGGLSEKKSGPGWGYVCVIDDSKDWRKNAKDVRWQIAFEKRMLEHTWFKVGEKFDPVNGPEELIKLWRDIISIAKARSTVFGHFLYNDVGDWALLKGEVAIGGDYFGHFYHTAPIAVTAVSVAGDGEVDIENNEIKIDYTLSGNSPKVTANLNLLNQDWSCYDNIRFTVSRSGQGPDSFKIIIKSKSGEEVVFRVNNIGADREIVLPRYGTSPAYRITKDWKNHLEKNDIEFVGDVITDWIQDWEDIGSIAIEIEADSRADLGSGSISISSESVMEVEGEKDLTTHQEALDSVSLPFLAHFNGNWVVVDKVEEFRSKMSVTFLQGDGKKETIPEEDFLKGWDGQIRTLKDFSNKQFLAHYEGEWVIVQEVSRRVKFIKLINGKRGDISLEDFFFNWDGKVREDTL